MRKLGIFVLVLSINLGLSACSSGASDESARAEDTEEVAADTKSGGTVVYLNEESFRNLVWNYNTNPQDWVYEGELPAVIDFYADWCGPCKRVAPIMDNLAKEYEGEVIIYKVDTDANRELSSVFGIRSIPSVLFIPKNGKPAMQPGAMQEEQYKQIIEEFVLGNKTTEE